MPRRPPCRTRPSPQPPLNQRRPRPRAPGEPAGVDAAYPDGVPAAGEAGPPAPAVPTTATPTPRRPLHMGPAVPDPHSGGVSVRSLADRGPAVSASGPPTSGPEYLDVPRDDTGQIPAQQTGDSGEPAAPTTGSAWPAARAARRSSR